MLPEHQQVGNATQRPHIRGLPYHLAVGLDHLGREVEQSCVGIDILVYSISFLFGQGIIVYSFGDCAAKIAQFVGTVDEDEIFGFEVQVADALGVDFLQR